MLSTLLLVTAQVAAPFPSQGPQAPPARSLAERKILPELRAAFAERPSDERYRVYAVLADRIDGDELRRRQSARASRAERRRELVDTLRAHADATQKETLALLAILAARGEVERVEQLWITNTVIFEGTAAATLAVAARPEVERIGWEPARPASAYTDVGPPLPAPPAPPLQPFGTIVYTEGFESGALGAEWTRSTTGCGRIRVTNLQGPRTGSFHLLVDASTDSCNSTATLVLTADLSSLTTAAVRFSFRDYSDEFNLGADILEASDDGGATWRKVGDLTGTDGTYITRTFALDPLGLAYVSNFMLRFRWSDNFTAPTDGFGFDNIEIGDLPPPPPPDPEPNIVLLQAPDLWDLGYDGAGVVLANIDSGTELTHPDLVNRIWQNPLETLNGRDDDLNGYVDDLNGWDFEVGDNDPSPGLSHGTSTAGIMVGDGGTGIVRTGMAPGAKLAICKIGDETNHWAAQQWGITVGVDCSSSSYSYKWNFVPKPDYHMHRMVEDVVLAAGIIHANSIGNQGNEAGTTNFPIPFNVSAPGNVPGPWRHPDQRQFGDQGVSAVLGCGGLELNGTYYTPSGRGPAAWENIRLYDGAYPHAQNASYWEYPFGGTFFTGTEQSLLKPDVVTYTNVTSTNVGGGHTIFGGTSAATPHLGGALALLRGTNAFAEPRHVAQAIQVTAVDMGPPGKDNRFGAGRLQVLDAALRLFHTVVAADQEPSAGTLLTLDHYGFPNETFVTTANLRAGQHPFVYGNGNPFLDDAQVIVGAGRLDGTGHAQLTFQLPNAPGLVLQFQSVADDTAGLTGQLLRSTFERVELQ